MASINHFKERAIENAQEAVALDKQGKYEQAFEAYMRALDQFALHCKYDKNPSSKEMIQKRMREYMDRAEYLKSVINNNTRTDDAGDGSSAVGQKKKPQDGDEADRARMASQLGSSIVSEKPNVHWDDVSGLEHAKDALKEAVILPVKFPQFFTGKRKPWKGILLYGPPGTGKSYLAKAVATEADSTFYSVSSSVLVSKWMGESEKLVSELFRIARASAPSIVFIDEVDSLGVGNNKEARVLILGATNMPEMLDPAIRRRFDKRIYIALPDAGARSKMFKIHLGETPNNLTDADFRVLGERTDQFSGSDINLVVKDCLMQPVRKVQEATHFRPARGPNGEQGFWEPCGPSVPGAQERDLSWFAKENLADKVLVPPITLHDFMASLERARPTVSEEDLAKYTAWTREFGEEGV